MRYSVGDRVAGSLLAAHRSDLIVADVEIPDELYHRVLAEVKAQHPEEADYSLKDRALYRILTHPEWSPLAKDPSGLTEAKDSPTPVLYRMMGAAAESARGAASSATTAALQAVLAVQYAERAESAQERTTISSQHAHAASEQAQRCSQLASTALEEYSRIAKRQMIIKFIIIGLLILGLALLVTRPAHGQDKVVYWAQGNESIRSEHLVYQSPPTITTASPAPPPPLTADQKFRIRDLQHRYDQIKLELAKLELEKLKLEKQVTDVLSSINGLAFDIAHESKIRTDDYNLDIDTLEWKARKR